MHPCGSVSIIMLLCLVALSGRRSSANKASLALVTNNLNVCHKTLCKFRSIICQVVAYGRLKTKENFKLLALKVVAVTYERWLLTRGSKHSDLTWKCWVFFENWSLRLMRGGHNCRFDYI